MLDRELMRCSMTMKTSLSLAKSCQRTVIALGILLAMVSPSLGYAEGLDAVRHSMQTMKAKAAQLGLPDVKAAEPSAKKNVPTLWFGTTKMNDNFALVDELQKANGGVATFFVKNGSDFVRISTNVIKADGTRAVGTLLDPKGKVYETIGRDKSFYGNANILGKPYVTGYEPIHDSTGRVVGIYFVGFAKGVAR